MPIYMSLSVIQTLRLGKQTQIEELVALSQTTKFVAAVGKLIHALQAERGASSIFLGSDGTLFADVCQVQARESEHAEIEFQKILEEQFEKPPFSKSKYFHYMSWVLIGLGELPFVRKRIRNLELSTDECLVIFGRLIASLVSVTFEVAESAVDQQISGVLVALFNLIQGKEFAGQERAIGALSFASGRCTESRKAKLSFLIDAQQRHFKLFEELAGEEFSRESPDIRIATSPELEALRQKLLDGDCPADGRLSNTWFEVCSSRLSAVWSLQCGLVKRLKDLCDKLIIESQSHLQDTDALLKMLSSSSPARAELASGLFDPFIPLEHLLKSDFPNGKELFSHGALIESFHAQSQRLASIEKELTAAKRALEERKTIERAKGILMARFNLSEDEAYRRMRSTAMEQNKRIMEVAEAVLTLVTLT